MKRTDADRDESQRLDLLSNWLEHHAGILGCYLSVMATSRTPIVTKFKALLVRGTTLAKVQARARDLALVLRTPSVRVYAHPDHDGSVMIEMTNVPAGDRFPFDAVYCAAAEARREAEAGSTTADVVRVLLGVVEDKPLVLNLAGEMPHLMIGGTTGAGKTRLMGTMIMSLALECPPWGIQPVPVGKTAAQLIMFDTKGLLLSGFEHLPHLARPMMRDAGEMAEALRSLVHLMRKRLKRGEFIPRIVVFIDELQALITDAPGCVKNLILLTGEGREAGIHVIASLQRAGAEMVPEDMKANFVGRIAGKCTSQYHVRTIAGWSCGAEHLSPGQFMVVSGGDVRGVFEAAHFDEETITGALGELQRCGWMPTRTAVPVHVVPFQDDVSVGVDGTGLWANGHTAQNFRATSPNEAEELPFTGGDDQTSIILASDCPPLIRPAPAGDGNGRPDRVLSAMADLVTAGWTPEAGWRIRECASKTGRVGGGEPFYDVRSARAALSQVWPLLKSKEVTADDDS